MNGFKHEKELTMLGIALGIISTALLIKVLLMQKEFFSLKLEEHANGNKVNEYE